ncbi:hypothetical protein [Thiothrix sp.]|jgi:hypothetical protein|uniref:hypothetical protein n=1 Tax=Thiothrix sp. TaxID=1032 RepID=UPI00257D90DC|nr:hypothetical protein [Thiothrix sp.]
MATKKTREYAKALSQQQAVEGLNWATPRGKAVALEIRAYKARVEAYQSERGIGWGNWNGAAESVFNAVPFEWNLLSDCEGGALFDAIHSKLIRAMVKAYKARVEAYQAAHGLNWASWRGNAESVFNAVAFDWDTVDDNDGGELFDAIANKVEHEYRAVKLAA